MCCVSRFDYVWVVCCIGPRHTLIVQPTTRTVDLGSFIAFQLHITPTMTKRRTRRTTPRQHRLYKNVIHLLCHTHVHPSTHMRLFGSTSLAKYPRGVATVCGSPLPVSCASARPRQTYEAPITMNVPFSRSADKLSTQYRSLTRGLGRGYQQPGQVIITALHYCIHGTQLQGRGHWEG